MAVTDVSRDLFFTGNPTLAAKGVRFCTGGYADMPLRDAACHMFGTLCLHDIEPRILNPARGQAA